MSWKRNDSNIFLCEPPLGGGFAARACQDLLLRAKAESYLQSVCYQGEEARIGGSIS